MGNGQSLHIWRDKWLTKPSNFKFTSSPANVPHDAKVYRAVRPADQLRLRAVHARDRLAGRARTAGHDAERLHVRHHQIGRAHV